MSERMKVLFAAALAAGLVTACNADNSSTNGAAMKLQLTSTAFTNGQPIPARHTADGQDVSPALQWAGMPPATKSLALICDDPDAPAGTWVHWVIYDLPPSAAGLSEGTPKSAELANGARQGVNDFKRTGYGGPAPPAGKAHRYFFKLYALDLEPNLKAGLTKQDLLKAMEGHILGEGQLVGTYQRK
jgi:Raf kinase inhibitor-like YbhB/YbcL family protein